MVVHLLIPAGQRIIIMSTRIYHAVVGIIVRQIVAFLSGIKGKLQHLHARIAGLRQHPVHALRQKSQILRNNIHLSKLFLQPPEQLHPRPLLPVAVLCRSVSVGYGIIGFKAPEMIDPHHVIELKAMAYPLDPPLISGLPVILPPIQGIAPELACGRKPVRRTARHAFRLLLFIKLKQLRRRPGIRAVRRHIDRQIADHADSLLIRIVLQLLPLAAELILLKTVKTQLLLQLPPRRLQSIRLPVAQALRPLIPAGVSLTVLDSHIKAVIFQPEAVPGCIFPVSFVLPEPFKSLPKRLKARPVNPPVIHLPRILAAVCLQTLLFRQKPFIL